MLGAHIKIKSGREFFVSALASSECVCVAGCQDAEVEASTGGCWRSNLVDCQPKSKIKEGPVNLADGQTKIKNTNKVCTLDK